MNIAIYGRSFGNNFSGMAIQLFEELKKHKINIYINKIFHDFICTKLIYTPTVADFYEKKLPQNVKIDFLLSIGGDGTFLESATIVGESGIPILGVNTGRLGFLAYVNSSNLITCINQLIQGNYTIDRRMMLDVSGENFTPDINFCLNEFAVQKKSKLHMIKIKIYANDNYINTYWGDGLIIATPTGSTAYSLSCGGPIVVPHSNVFSITPIANHNLSVRPLIISAESELKIIIDSNEDNVLLSLDYRTYNIKDNKIFYIKRKNFYINFVNLFENNYFSTLREKLMWGIDLRN